MPLTSEACVSERVIIIIIKGLSLLQSEWLYLFILKAIRPAWAQPGRHQWLTLNSTMFCIFFAFCVPVSFRV